MVTAATSLSDNFQPNAGIAAPVGAWPLAALFPPWRTRRTRLLKSLFVWAKSFLPTYILNLLATEEMRHSIEGRVPFLNHHVVECLCRVPVPLKIRGMTEKYLLRQAAKPVITDTVYRRQKHPFLSPPVTPRRPNPSMKCCKTPSGAWARVAGLTIKRKSLRSR